VSFFLTSSTSLFSTEPITSKQQISAPRPNSPKNNQSEQASKARQANLKQWEATSAVPESAASACTCQPKGRLNPQCNE
jgi:hypothetical protein